MDLLWIKDGAVEVAFEVESTTTMTSGLQRGSNLPANTRKVMVLPEERKPDFDRKMMSPLFLQAFSGHSWNLLYFDQFRSRYSADGAQTKIEEIFGELAQRGPKDDRSTTDQSSFDFGGQD